MDDLPYYLWLDEKQAGPYTLAQLRGMWTHGVITGDQLFWQEGNSDWQPLAHTPELVSSLSVLPGRSAPPPLAWRGLLTLVGVLLLLVVALAVTFLRHSLRAATPAQQAVSSPLPTPTPAPVSVADLERTYREAATTLQDQLRAALAQEATQTRLLGRARTEEVETKKLQVIDARRNGSFLAPQPGETLLDVRLVDMTDRPPLLNEDASDLYHRYKSVLKFQANIEAPTMTATANMTCSCSRWNCRSRRTALANGSSQPQKACYNGLRRSATSEREAIGSGRRRKFSSGSTPTTDAPTAMQAACKALADFPKPLSQRRFDPRSFQNWLPGCEAS